MEAYICNREIAASTEHGELKRLWSEWKVQWAHPKNVSTRLIFLRGWR
jgi:hypothetical protein